MEKLKKQLEEVQKQIFIIEMIDRWETSDSIAWSRLKDKELELKNSIKEQINVKSLKEQNELIQKWKKKNVIRKEALIPKKNYEWFEKELDKMGISYNKWVNQKINEMIGIKK